MTPEEGARSLRKACSGMRRGLIRAADQCARRVVTQAIADSQGTLTYRDLAALDHPYARRHGAPQRDASEINRHTGLFTRSWYRLPARVEGGAVVASAINAAFYSGFLDAGTVRMFARPVAQRAIGEVRPECEALVEQAAWKPLEA